MSDIIYIDTSTIIRREKTIEEMEEVMLDFLIEVAIGRIKTKADQLYQNDFIMWKSGI